MGIASLVATDRFHTTAEQLSTLAVAQLIVYAAMQIPVGLLLDRYGARVLLSIGALSMAAGQYTVAFAPSLGIAVVGRMLVGFGDAFTFISMIRLINGW
ncbi:MAG: MFS transporter, partial [Actinomycetales bacterium]|nr:MFS transporter [Actinomycetales bacterium]